jgi:hypothetical protein
MNKNLYERAIDREVQKLLVFPDSDLELIASMSIEEVDAELFKLGINPHEPLPQRLTILVASRGDEIAEDKKGDEDTAESKQGGSPIPFLRLINGSSSPARDSRQGKGTTDSHRKERTFKKKELNSNIVGSNGSSTSVKFPLDPLAKTLGDLIEPGQLIAIREIEKSQGINAQAECMRILQSRPEELSRQAASAFIEHLRGSEEAQEILRKMIG